MWDYHVILVQGDMIWDYDSDVPYPCPVSHYLTQVLKVEEGHLLQSRFRRLYRVLDSEVYRDRFASDRSHMLNDAGSYLAAPPNYAPIVASDGETMTLPVFTHVSRVDLFPGPVSTRSISKADFPGIVLDEQAFIALVTHPPENLSLSSVE